MKNFSYNPKDSENFSNPNLKDNIPSLKLYTCQSIEKVQTINNDNNSYNLKSLDFPYFSPKNVQNKSNINFLKEDSLVSKEDQLDESLGFSTPRKTNADIHYRSIKQALGNTKILQSVLTNNAMTKMFISEFIDYEREKDLQEQISRSENSSAKIFALKQDYDKLVIKYDFKNPNPHFQIGFKNDYDKVYFSMIYTMKLPDFPSFPKNRLKALRFKAIFISKVYLLLYLLIVFLNVSNFNIQTRNSIRIQNTENKYFENINELFLGFYSIELLIRIILNWFCFEKLQFFIDFWNIIDIFSLISGYIWLFTGHIEFVYFKFIRMLTLTRIFFISKRLNNVQKAVYISIFQITNALFILLFYVLILSVIFLNLYFKYDMRVCMNIENGIQISPVVFCADSSDCMGEFAICAYSVKKYDSEDNVFDFTHSFFHSLKILTLDNYTGIISKYLISFENPIMFLYFIFILIGNYLLLPVILVIIKTNFTEIYEKINKQKFEKIAKENIKDSYLRDLYRILRDLKFWNRYRNFRNLKIVNILIPDKFQKDISIDSFHNRKISFAKRNNISRIEARRIGNTELDIRRFSTLFKEITDKSWKKKLKNFLLSFKELFNIKYKENKVIKVRISDMKIEINYDVDHKFNSFQDVIEDQKNYIDKVVAVERRRLSVIKNSKKMKRVYKLPGKSKFKESLRFSGMNQTINAKFNMHRNNSEFEGRNSGEAPPQILENLLDEDIEINYENLKKVLNSNRNIQPVIEEVNTNTTEFDNYMKYFGIILKDIRSKKIMLYPSDIDVLENSLLEKRIKLLRDLNSSYRDFRNEYNLKWFRQTLKSIFFHRFFRDFIYICIFSDITVLLFLGILDEEIVKTFDLIFTIILFVDGIVRIWLTNPKIFFMDNFNALETIVNIVSIGRFILKAIYGKTDFLRFIMTIKILRTIRILFSNKFIENIFKFLWMHFKSFGDVLLLFLVCVMIVTCYVFQFFYKIPLENEYTESYVDFLVAFTNVFSLFTMDSWSKNIQVYTASSNWSKALLLIMTISAFIGNLFLLNILISIVLDTFNRTFHTEIPDIENKENEEEKTEKKNIRGGIKMKTIIGRKQGNSKIQPSNINKNTTKSKTNRRRSILNRVAIHFKRNNLQDYKCKRSMYLFSKTNKLRLLAVDILNSNIFYYGVLFNTFLASIQMVRFSQNSRIFDSIIGFDYHNYDIFINLTIFWVYFAEFICILLMKGFFICKYSMMRNMGNILDTLILFSLAINLFIPQNALSFRYVELE